MLRATAVIKVTDPGLPKARLVQALDVKRAGADDVTVVITYEDAHGIQRESLGLGDVRIFGPNAFHQFADLVSAEPTDNGRQVTASYRVTPPTGKWREADRGTYVIEMKAFRVANKQGNFVPEAVLGRFYVLQMPERR
jgi:hypothetical protein